MGSRRLLLAAAVAALAGGAGAAYLSAPLTLLDSTTAPLARCMDGSPGGFYLQPAADPASENKWVLFLEGGGECADETSCYAALSGPLGSSKYFSPSRTFDTGVLYANSNPGDSPDLAGWTHVDVPYCSQDLHTGQVVQPSAATWGLWFAGHHIFTAVLDALDLMGLVNATDIILSGASAGGIGVWPNLDFLSQRYPSARVVGAPIAGFYFYAYPYTGVNHTASTLADFTPGAWPQHYQLWSSFVDADCAAALAATPWACLLSNYSFPFVSSETFAAEAQTDEVVLTGHDWLPAQYRTEPPEQAYMAEWSANMTVALAPLLAPEDTGHGAFNPSCFIHTDFYPNSPIIDGLNFLQAFGNWYWQRTPPSGYKLADDCGITCNPTCQH